MSILYIGHFTCYLILSNTEKFAADEQTEAERSGDAPKVT